jgi:hypothetical protein
VVRSTAKRASIPPPFVGVIRLCPDDEPVRWMCQGFVQG